MNWLNDYLSNHAVTRKFIDGTGTIAHLHIKQESLLYLGAIQANSAPLFVVKENEHQVNELVSALKELDETLRVVVYSHEESLRVESIAESDVMRLERVNALHAIINQDFDICITHAIASIRKMSPKKVLQQSTLTLHVNQEINPENLAKRLIQQGYTRVKYVERPFTFAIRGGICDVFSPQEEQPLRIEFFDVDVESLRYFDITTQRSINEVKEATILFANDVVLQKEDVIQIKEKVLSHLVHEDASVQGEIGLQLDFLEAYQYDASMYPLLAEWDNFETIYNYTDNVKTIISPIEAVVRSLQQNEIECQEFITERHDQGVGLLLFGVYPDWRFIETLPTILIYEYEHADELHLPWHAAELAVTSLNDTLRLIRKESIDQCVIAVLDETDMEDFTEILLQESMPYMIFDETTKPGFYIQYGTMRSGVVFDDVKIRIYGRKELFQYQKKHYRYDNKFMKAEALNELNDLSAYDYVVHRQYGIGRYLGITTKEVDGIYKDFMRIMYRDNDELFVPLEQFSLVRKYISSEAVSVRLSKLGSSAWRKSQERIKESVQDVANRLVELYTERMSAQGFAFSQDTAYQQKFEAEFPYELTQDQKVAIEEIKRDMEASKPMDRLLCGDVGFGKTEVAIRAAFKAIVDKKQVAFLCPTTILSAQHNRTFKERFKDYPITVEVLNRFVPPSKQKEILKRFAHGQVDVLIGTHRILSKDVKVHDLGLLIIDEEQRFGVEHKERIKEMKVSVDVLSLSATPIPRTLQMSLVGLRSLSQLNTPPSNRLPVMTYIIERNQKTIYDVIRKELNRNGQAFYLFNDVEHIYSVASMIQVNVEQATVGVVHGQMDRDEIEDVMFRFINKEINTLVCTTIIETGIDIPNANTIIVDNAHRFGLSQLYQIKGRVGRSSRLAYAYFVVPSKKALTEVAQKRLQAIKEFTQLGSGYKIAMRDLTIRGAGELLGGNQSGFIDTVGIDMYVELLKEAIDQRKGISKQDEKPVLNLKIEGYLPEDFTTDDAEKLEIYQEINNINSFNDLSAFNESIRDRYGKLPNTVVMLLEKKRLELFLEDDRIKSFKEIGQRAELVFTEEYSDRVDGIKLFEIVSNRSYEIKIKYIRKTIILTIPMYDEWVEDTIYILEHIKEEKDETR